MTSSASPPLAASKTGYQIGVEGPSADVDARRCEVRSGPRGDVGLFAANVSSGPIADAKARQGQTSTEARVGQLNRGALSLPYFRFQADLRSRRASTMTKSASATAASYRRLASPAASPLRLIGTPSPASGVWKMTNIAFLPASSFLSRASSTSTSATHPYSPHLTKPVLPMVSSSTRNPRPLASNTPEGAITLMISCRRSPRSRMAVRPNSLSSAWTLCASAQRSADPTRWQ